MYPTFRVYMFSLKAKPYGFVNWICIYLGCWSFWWIWFWEERQRDDSLCRENGRNGRETFFKCQILKIPWRKYPEFLHIGKESTFHTIPNHGSAVGMSIFWLFWQQKWWWKVRLSRKKDLSRVFGFFCCCCFFVLANQFQVSNRQTYLTGLSCRQINNYKVTMIFRIRCQIMKLYHEKRICLRKTPKLWSTLDSDL